MPLGLRGTFNLALDVNDEVFVEVIQNVMNQNSSRILDLAYQQTVKKETALLVIISELKEQILDGAGEDAAEVAFNELKRTSVKKCEQKSQVLMKKLRVLRTERQNVGNDTIEVNGGSRKLFGQRYIKERDKGEVFGAPFPKYIRPARRNRPNRRTRVNNNNQEYVVTADDLEERNPIIASKKDLDISDDAKALYRKGPKFCPTPRGPVDEMEQYKSFLRFQRIKVPDLLLRMLLQRMNS